jgi:hypothetical protein
MDSVDELAGVTVVVRIRRNDLRTARVHASAIEGLHWAPNHTLYGFIACDQIIQGAIAHECAPATRPHRLPVCIIAKDNAKSYRQLADQAGDKASSTK